MKSNCHPKITSWEKLPVILDIPTVALIFGVTDQTVKHLIYRGELPAFKLGKSWRMNRDDLRAISANTNEERSAP